MAGHEDKLSHSLRRRICHAPSQSTFGTLRPQRRINQVWGLSLALKEELELLRNLE